MMQRMLGAGRETVVFDVTAGTLPEPRDCDAYVLTGSSVGVYDDLPWIPGLTAFLRRARGQAKLVGICFGHQVMAETFGGRVVKSDRGWGIGLQRYDVIERAWWMDQADHVEIPASHQDQVVEPPLCRPPSHSPADSRPMPAWTTATPSRSSSIRSSARRSARP